MRIVAPVTLALLASFTVLACGKSDPPPKSIASMPAYPDAKESKDTKAASTTTTTSSTKSSDLKTICQGAKDLKAAKYLPEDKDGAFGSGASASFKAKGDKPYTMADLQALEKKSAWEELLGHAEDIAPSARNAAWEKMVENAATNYMQNMTKDDASFEGAFVSQSFVKRYAFLAKSDAFMKKRGEAGRNAAEICLKESYRGQHCIELMKDFLKVDGTGAEVGFQFGKVTRKNQNAYVAVPFFKWALDKKKDSAMCTDEDLKLATVAGLGLPPDYDNAVASRSIASDACWDSLAPAIKKELVDDQTGYFRDNACAVLKAKGAL